MKSNRASQISLLFGLILVTALIVSAQTDHDAWLRYSALSPQQARTYGSLPVRLTVLGHSPVLKSAEEEMISALAKLTGRKPSSSRGITGDSIVLGTFDDLKTAGLNLHSANPFADDGYWLTRAKVHGFQCVVITSKTTRGVLFGVFGLLSKIARGENIAHIDEVQQPYAPVRWVDQWDNLDGSIERGYGGRSIFFADGKVRDDLTRAGEYARLLASIGINGCTINNVNAAPGMLDDAFIVAGSPHRRCVSSVGRAAFHVGRFEQPENRWWTRYIRSARSASR